MSITNDTWIVVADGKKAVYLKNTGDAAAPQFRALPDEMCATGTARAKVWNKPGDVVGNGHPGNSSADIKGSASENFAKSLADNLYELAHQGAFDRLVICASRDVLAEVHRTLHKDVSARIIADVPTFPPENPVEPFKDIFIL